MDRAERRYLVQKHKIRVYRALKTNDRLDGTLNGVPVTWRKYRWHNYYNWARWLNADDEDKVPEFNAVYWWRTVMVTGCRCSMCRGMYGKAVKQRARGSKTNTAWRKEIWQLNWT